ncbi:MAG: GNAT family N-acetyltransferase [Acidobacteriota bacterium]|nr:GNAT family N-acetyltransferase [Acidobacteriota bacterium]
MSYTLGRASLRDVPQLVQLRMGYLSADFGALMPEQEEELAQDLPAYFELHLDYDLLAFVARDEDDAIVCCAWLLLVDKPPSPRFPHGKTGTLFNVYTVPGHRRRGLARRVMGLLLDAARDLALDVVELHATEEGYSLYRSLGFADDSTTHKAMRMML